MWFWLTRIIFARHKNSLKYSRWIQIRASLRPGKETVPRPLIPLFTASHEQYTACSHISICANRSLILLSWWWSDKIGVAALLKKNNKADHPLHIIKLLNRIIRAANKGLRGISSLPSENRWAQTSDQWSINKFYFYPPHNGNFKLIRPFLPNCEFTDLILPNAYKTIRK